MYTKLASKTQMTYRELLTQLQQLTEEQLGNDVTVYDCESGEYYRAPELVYTTTAVDELRWDVLGPDHPVIRF